MSCAGAGGTEISLIVGQAQDLPLQAYVRGGVMAVFASGDTITAGVYQPESNLAMFTPDVAWYTASNTQNGYGQGQVDVSITNAEAAFFVPGVVYTLVVFWSPATDPQQSAAIIRVRLVITSISLR